MITYGILLGSLWNNPDLVGSLLTAGPKLLRYHTIQQNTVL